jgi:hypothetical protein
MKRASTSEAHTRRAKPAEKLRRLSKVKVPDMSRIWDTFPQLPGDSTRFIEKDRDR